MTEPSSDRRAHARVPVNTKATVLVRHNAGVSLSIETLSLGGASLIGEITVLVGDLAHILFEVEGHPIDVPCEVVRTDKLEITVDRIAVRFTDLDDAATSRIEQLVRRFLDLEEQRLGV